MTTRKKRHSPFNGCMTDQQQQQQQLAHRLQHQAGSMLTYGRCHVKWHCAAAYVDALAARSQLAALKTVLSPTRSQDRT